MAEHSLYDQVRRHRDRSGLTVIEFLVIVAIIAVIVALFLPATRTSRGAARRTQCKNNLKQIGLAIHNYAETYQSLPPAYTVDERGNRLHSWRTLILPFMDQQALYEMIDLTKPWSDPVNAQARETVIALYQCPSTEGPPTHTTYQAIVGEANFFHPERSRQFDEIKDGTSNTVMVMETLPKDAVHWMSPNDVDGDYLSAINEDSETAHRGGGNLLLGDGAVRFYSMSAPFEVRQPLTTIDAGDEVEDW